MNSQTQESVSVLVGLPLWSLGRAADLAWFEFGNRRTVQGTTGAKEVGDYALHVQCSWRITQGNKIVTGRGDIFCSPVEDDQTALTDFDWQKDNRFDRVVAQLFQPESREFQVTGAEVGKAGSLSVTFQDGYKLEVMPQDSEFAEHWRFFKPCSAERHLVFSGRGLQYE